MSQKPLEMSYEAMVFLFPVPTCDAGRQTAAGEDTPVWFLSIKCKSNAQYNVCPTKCPSHKDM